MVSFWCEVKGITQTELKSYFIIFFLTTSFCRFFQFKSRLWIYLKGNDIINSTDIEIFFFKVQHRFDPYPVHHALSRQHQSFSFCVSLDESTLFRTQAWMLRRIGNGAGYHQKICNQISIGHGHGINELGTRNGPGVTL